MSKKPTDAELHETLQRKILYRDIIDKIEELQTVEVGKRTMLQVKNILYDMVDVERALIESDVFDGDEQVMNFAATATIGNVIIKCLEHVNIANVTYDPQVFTSKIVATDEDLLSLMKDARTIIKDVPKLSYINGSFCQTRDTICHQQRKTQQSQKAVKATTTQVNVVDENDASVRNFLKILRKALKSQYEENDNEPIDYFQFVLDSDDFTKTVENVFYTSFLIKDGKASIEYDGGNNCMIQPMQSNDQNKKDPDEGVNSQLLLSMTMDDWENWKEAA